MQGKILIEEVNRTFHTLDRVLLIDSIVFFFIAKGVIARKTCGVCLFLLYIRSKQNQSAAIIHKLLFWFGLFFPSSSSFVS